MRLFVGILFSMILATASPADRIVLIYGDVLEGSVIAETDTTVTIRGPFGERLMQKSDIREVTKDAAQSAPGTPEASSAVQAPPRPLPAGAWPSESPGAPPTTQRPSAPQPSAFSAPQATGIPLPPRDLPPAPQALSVAPPPPPPSWTATGQQPTPYDLLKTNADMQGSWKDLEISYIQRAFNNGQAFETRYIARIVPPNYLRAKLISPIAPSAQYPQGGQVEYDMYRAKGTLWQVATVPGQPVQYLQMDASRVEKQAAASSLESFRYGFSGAATDEILLQALSLNSTILGSEITDGHDCWVLETKYAPDVVQAQVRKYEPKIQPTVRQQLSQIGRIRNWVGKQDLIQWRMESFSAAGAPLLAMTVLSLKPNSGLDPQQLRMKVPKGTEWLDITDLVSNGVSQLMSGQPVQSGGQQGQGPNTQISQPPPSNYQAPPPAAWQPPQATSAPQQGWPQQQQTYQPQVQQQPAFNPPPQQTYSYPQQGQTNPQMMQKQAYSPQQSYQPQTAPQGYGQQGVPQAYQQSYVQQGYPGMPQQQPMQQQQQSGSGGGFLSRLFGGGKGTPQPQQQQMPVSGYSPQGNPTMMVPMVNGQPQFPTQQR
jgi:hypothetical protein